MSGQNQQSPPPEIPERLAQIERHLAEIRSVLETLRRPPEPRDAGRALRRLAIVVWGAGLLAIGAGSWIAGLEVWRDPRANVCATDEAEAYAECLREPEAGSGSLLDSLRSLVAGADVDPERVVRRWQTERHATSLRRFAGVAVAWTVAAAAAFAVLGWVGRGLRRRR